MSGIYKPTKENLNEFHLKNFTFELDSDNDSELVIGNLIGPDGNSIFSESVEFISNITILYRDYLIIKIKNSYNIYCLDTLKLLFYEIIDNIDILEENIVELTLENGKKILYQLSSNMMINIDPNYRYLYLSEFNPKSLDNIHINHKNRTIEIDTKLGILVKKLKNYLLSNIRANDHFELHSTTYHQNSVDIIFNDNLKLVDGYNISPNMEISPNSLNIKKVKTVMYKDDYYSSLIDLSGIKSQTFFTSYTNNYFMILNKYVNNYNITLCYDNKVFVFDNFTQFYEISDNRYLISGHGFKSDDISVDTNDTGILLFNPTTQQFEFNSLTRLNINGYKQLNSDIDNRLILSKINSDNIPKLSALRIPRFEDICQYFLFHEFGRIFNLYNNNWYIIELDDEIPEDPTKVRQLTDLYYTYEGGLYKIEQLIDNYLDESLARIIKLRKINSLDIKFENSAILQHFIFESNGVRKLINKDILIRNGLSDVIGEMLFGVIPYYTRDFRKSTDIRNNNFDNIPNIIDLINIVTDQGELELGYLSETKDGHRVVNTNSGTYLIDDEILPKFNSRVKYLSYDGNLFIYSDKFIYKLYNTKYDKFEKTHNNDYMEFNSVLYHNDLNLFVVKSDKNDYFYVYNMECSILENTTRSRTISGLFKNRYEIFGNSGMDFSVFVVSEFQHPISYINLQNFLDWCEIEFDIQLNSQQTKLLNNCIIPFLNNYHDMRIVPEIKMVIPGYYMEIEKTFRQKGSSLLLKLLALKLAEQGNRVKLITRDISGYDKIMTDYDRIIIQSNVKMDEYIKSRTKIEYHSSNRNNNIFISFNTEEDKIGTITIASKFIDEYQFNTDIILVDENIGDLVERDKIRGLSTRDNDADSINSFICGTISISEGQLIY